MKHIKKLIENTNGDDESLRILGLLIYYSYHDGIEYKSEQEIMDAEETFK